MVKQQPISMLLLGGLMSGALLGCSEEKAERLLNQETYSFTGVYDNPHNGDLMEFKDAQVTITKEEGVDFTKPFEVDDNHLTIQMRNSSKEKRDDIVMRIHGEKELLTCSVCAKYQLASTWRKRGFVPSSKN